MGINRKCLNEEQRTAIEKQPSAGKSDRRLSIVLLKRNSFETVWNGQSSQLASRQTYNLILIYSKNLSLVEHGDLTCIKDLGAGNSNLDTDSVEYSAQVDRARGVRRSPLVGESESAGCYPCVGSYGG